MSRLFVITFKRPALEIEKMTMNIEFAYDCEATGIPEVAEIRYKDALNKYEDVEMFECEDYEYIEFVKNDDFYAKFTRTGEHSMKPIESMEEDVDVGTDNRTETIHLSLEMIRPNDESSFDYHVDIDDVGQIVFTPDNSTVSFVNIQRLTEDAPNNDVVDGNTRRFSVLLTANMISDNDDFDWFCDIDEIGQAVVTPNSESTSFLTVSVDNSLNLVTESSELNEDSYKEKNNNAITIELCEEVIDDLENLFKEVIKKAEKIEEYFYDLKIHSADIEPYMIRYIEQFISSPAGDVSVEEFRRRIEEFNESSSEEDINESIDNINRDSIITRFMQGEISIFSDDGEPLPQYIHLDELDSTHGKIVYEYYYDQESDSVVSYTRGVR